MGVSFRKGTNRGGGVSFNLQSRSLWCVSICGYGAAMVRAFTHHTRWFGCVVVPFRGGTNRGGGVSCTHAMRIALVRPWCVPSRTIHDGLVVWEFRFVKVRTGAWVCVSIRFVDRNVACHGADIVHVMVRLWCVPSHTIHDGLVVWVFRFVKARTVAGVCRSICKADRFGACQYVAMVRPWCVPSRTILGRLMGLGVPFREGTNRGVGVSWNPQSGLPRFVSWCCTGAAHVRPWCMS